MNCKFIKKITKALLLEKCILRIENFDTTLIYRNRRAVRSRKVTLTDDIKSVYWLSLYNFKLHHFKCKKNEIHNMTCAHSTKVSNQNMQRGKMDMKLWNVQVELFHKSLPPLFEKIYPRQLKYPFSLVRVPPTLFTFSLQTSTHIGLYLSMLLKMRKKMCDLISPNRLISSNFDKIA